MFLMRYLHTMIRVKNLEQSLDFFVNKLGLIVVRRKEVPQGQFTLVFLATEQGGPEIELTHNWGSTEDYSEGRNFGHLAYEVENIYNTCESLMKNDVVILRPPRDGYMAFIRSPDNISIELLQAGEALAPAEPWSTMKNVGHW